MVKQLTEWMTLQRVSIFNRFHDVLKNLTGTSGTKYPNITYLMQERRKQTIKYYNAINNLEL